jgi:hypothetical protein
MEDVLRDSRRPPRADILPLAPSPLDQVAQFTGQRKDPRAANPRPFGRLHHPRSTSPHYMLGAPPAPPVHPALNPVRVLPPEHGVLTICSAIR